MPSWAGVFLGAFVLQTAFGNNDLGILVRVDEAKSQRQDGSLGPVGDVEFRQNGAHIIANRTFG